VKKKYQGRVLVERQKSGCVLCSSYARYGVYISMLICLIHTYTTVMRQTRKKKKKKKEDSEEGKKKRKGREKKEWGEHGGTTSNEGSGTIRCALEPR